jgi:hypothetical protein
MYDALRMYTEPATWIDRPLKVTTPLDASTCAVPSKPPGPDATDSVTSEWNVVTMLLWVSFISSAGCEANCAPATLLLGCVVKCSPETSPAEIANADESAVGMPEACARRVYRPAKVIDKPLNVATPLDAATLTVPPNEPLPVATDNATVAENDGTVLPPASLTVTTGCGSKAAPATLSPGLVVKIRDAASPGVIVTLFEFTVNEVPAASSALAPRMYVDAISSDRPVNVATPATALTDVVPLRTPPADSPSPPATTRLTAKVAEGTVLSYASTNATTGCVGKGTAPVLSAG